MFDLAPYNSNPLARILDTRQQRALSREIAEVTRPAQRKQAHITSTAKVSMTEATTARGLRHRKIRRPSGNVRAISSTIIKYGGVLSTKKRGAGPAARR